MSVHDKLVEHAFRRWERQEQPSPARQASYSEAPTHPGAYEMSGLAPAQAGLGPPGLSGPAAALARQDAPSAAGQSSGGGQPRRTGAFRRVAVVVRTPH